MINIYLDTSGSMTEMGKNSAIVYVAKSIQDYCDFNAIKSCCYKLDGSIIENVPSVRFNNDLHTEIDSVMNNSILISDGLFAFKYENIYDIAISIGIGADLHSLEKISKKLFENDNVLSALEYLIFQNNLLDNDEVKESGVEEDDEW